VAYSNYEISPKSYKSFTGFIFMHIACFAAIWTGVTTEAVILGIALYVIRVFGITGGFHRLFAHRTYKTSRVFQFIIAFMGQMSMQRGVIWWAAKHREHHRDSDTPVDAHSPVQHGFWFSHCGWVFNEEAAKADYDRVPDLTAYPELVWLDKNKYGPGILTGLICWLIAGWPGLVVGFFWSTVAVYHATFCINSLAHVFGRARYLTGDESKNSFLLGIIALGEGWHNNHHYYMASARNGFMWWEIDITYYILKVLSWFGIVWDLKQPPERILKGDRQLPAHLLDRLGMLVAQRFPADEIIARVKTRMGEAQLPEAKLPELVKAELPSLDEINARASKFLARTDELKEVVARAHNHLAETVSARLNGQERIAEAA